MTLISFFIDGKAVECAPGQTLLQVCRKNGIPLPTLCFLEGLGNVGACRLCLVEIEGSPRLFPACTTPAAPNMKVRTDSERLKEYRKMTVELLFAERNHVCAVCVSNGACELQDLAAEVGMTRVRFPYLFPTHRLDGTHRLYNMDHNRCVLCTRCVRVCDEVEGAHHWDVAGRGHNSRIISDFDRPWGDSDTCTDCGKCVEVCPTGALWPKALVQGKIKKEPMFIAELVERRKSK